MKVRLRDEIDLIADQLSGWLLGGKIYSVLSVEQYNSMEVGFRVASENDGQPALFKASNFEVTDCRLPKCWRVLAVRSNAVELGPELFAEDGFWERFFDRDPAAIASFHRAKQQVLADS